MHHVLFHDVVALFQEEQGKAVAVGRRIDAGAWNTMHQRHPYYIRLRNRIFYMEGNDSRRHGCHTPLRLYTS